MADTQTTSARLAQPIRDARRMAQAAGQTPDGSESPHAAACYMRTDMQALLTCDAIYLLAGWELSEGATAEFLAARAAGLAILFELHGAGVAS